MEFRRPRIIWTGQSRVHDSLPLLCCSLLHIELQLFPISIDHCVDVVVILRSAVQAECQTVRVTGQIDRGADAVPGDIPPPEPAPAQRRMISTERNHLLEELENVLIGSELAPIQPSNFIVLVIGLLLPS